MSLFATEKALQKELENVPGIPAIAWPNVKFEPTKDDPFVRPTILPGKSGVYTLNEFNKHQGIYQVDIYVPTNKGIKTLYHIADNIKDHFRGNKRLTNDGQTVFIMSVEIGRSERQDAYFASFIEIEYLSYN